MSNPGGLRNLPRGSLSERLGQLLLRRGLINSEQLRHGLRTHVREGQRLGSTLVALGYLQADDLSRVLGIVHGMAPVAMQLFARRDSALVSRLPAELALSLHAIPLARIAGSQHCVAVAVTGPLPAQAEKQLAQALDHEVYCAIAPELLIRQYLSSLYGISGVKLPRLPQGPALAPLTDEDAECEMDIALDDVHLRETTQRDAVRPTSSHRDSSVDHAGGMGRIDNDEARDELDGDGDIEINTEIELDLDEDISDANHSGISSRSPGARPAMASGTQGRNGDGHIATAHAPSSPSPDTDLSEPQSKQTLLDAIPEVIPDIDSSRTTNPVTLQRLGRVKVRRLSSNAGSLAELATTDDDDCESGEDLRTIKDVERAMRRSTGRDRVGELAVQAMRDLFDEHFEACLILVLRPPFAVGWKGFISGGGHSDAVEALALPLSAPSAIVSAYENGRPIVGEPPGGGTDVDQRMWNVLGLERPKLIAAAPVVLQGRTACIMYAQARQPQTIDNGNGDLGTRFTELVTATANAFERLLRAAER